MRRLPLAAVLILLACAHAQPGPPAPSAPEPFPDPFHVIAHRGASAHAPENTLPAFRRALELGAFEVELDVQLSRDGAVVLFHDGTLDEKTDLRGRVRDHPVDALRRTDIGTWFDRTHPGVPETWAGTPLVTLDEVFETFGAELHYHVEIKSEDAALPEAILASVARHGLDRRVTLTSFSMDQLLRVRALDASLPTCLLLPRQGDAAAQRRAIDAALVLGAVQVGVHASHATPELVATARDRGLEMRAWGIRGDADMDRAIAAGTNGMTVDWPERLIARLVRWKARPASAR